MALSNVDPHDLTAKKAKVDLSAKQFRYVKLNSENELEVCGEGQAGYVLTDTPKAGEYGTIIIGKSFQKVLCKATIKVGDLLCSDGEGAAIVAAGSSGHLILGVAQEAGVSGDLIETVTALPIAKA